MKIEFYMCSKRKIKPYYVHFKVISKPDPDQLRRVTSAEKQV